MPSELAARKSAGVIVDGKTLETCYIAPEGEHRPTIVLLHEALGSLSLWKDFPERLAHTTGCGVLAYSRYGHGKSQRLQEKRDIDYIHHEGEVVLPELLEKFGLENPILFGHSDGGSIALTYAGAYPGKVGGLILEAPHVFVEDITVTGVLQAGAQYQTELRSKLSRHHQDTDGIFHAWHDLWSDPQFRRWSIESHLPAISCPLLLIQGEHDGYGTIAQLQRIQEQVSQTQLCILPGCGHSPHREQTDIVLARIMEFMTGTHQMWHGLTWAATALSHKEIFAGKVNAR